MIQIETKENTKGPDERFMPPCGTEESGRREAIKCKFNSFQNIRFGHD